MRRRLAVASLLTALVATPLAHAVPASAQPTTQPTTQPAAQPTTQARAAKALLRASLPDLIPGEQVSFTAGRPQGKGYKKLSRADKRRAKLVLQRKVGSSWRKIGAAPLATKRVKLSWTTPTAASGTVVVRTVAKLKKRTFRGGRLALPVVAQSLRSTPGALGTAAPVSFAASLVPARPGRPVVLEVHDGTSWKAVGQPVASDAAGAATATTQSPAYPVWYRLVAAASNGAPAMTTAPVRTTFTQPVPGVIAHRAGAAAAPEQTLAAVRRALADGAPAMEVDIQLTKDLEMVIVHDPTLARTTNVEQVFPDRAPWNLADFTLAEIKTLDAGSWFGPQFAGERIPTLEELLVTLDKRAHLVIEVKSPGDTGNEQIDEMLLDALVGGHLKDLDDAGKLSFSSFDAAWLEAFAAQTDAPVGVLTTAAPTVAQLDAWKAWGADEVHPNVYLARRDVVDAIRARAMTTSVWTVNSVNEYRTALGLGADQIITDHPRRLAEVLNPPMPAA